MSKPKILIVGGFPIKGKEVYGGIITSCELLLKSTIRDRFEIIILDSSQISNPPPNIVIRGLLSISRLFLLIIKILKHKPQASLIFASDGWSSIDKGLMILICRFYGSKTLIFPRAGNLINQVESSKTMLKLIKNFFGSSDMFLCQGIKWNEFAINKLNIHHSKVKILNNWTATENQLNIGKNRNFSSDDRITKIIFVGWLEEFKGVFELLEACNNLYLDGVKFHLTFVGGGNAEKLAKEYSSKHTLNECISFFGWASSLDLNKYLEESDIFVLPSWYEGLPNAMIEAMAAGLAVVTTSVGVIPDYIQHEKHALLVPPKNVELLEESLKRLIIDADLRSSIGMEGHNIAANLFSVESNTRMLGDILEDLIKIEKSFFIQAPNIKHGGGMLLLKQILKSSINAKIKLGGTLSYELIKDSKLSVSSLGSVKLFKSGFIHHLISNFYLFKKRTDYPVYLFFGNIPPLIRLRGKVILYVHNKLIFEPLGSHSIPIKSRLKLVINKLLIKIYSKNVDLIVVQTPSMKSLAEDQMPSNKIICFPFYNYEVNGNTTNKIYDFIYPSYGYTYKNHKNLIEGLINLSYKGLFPSIVFALDSVIDLELIKKIESKSKKFNLNIKLILDEDIKVVNNLYKQSRCLIWPSFTESLGLPIIEAFRNDLDIVAADLDYINDLVQIPDSWLFNPYSAEEIANCMEDYLDYTSEPKKRNKLLLKIHSSDDFLQKVLFK